MLVKKRQMMEEEYSELLPKKKKTVPRKKAAAKLDYALRRKIMTFVGVCIIGIGAVTGVVSMNDMSRHDLVKDKILLTTLQKENEQLHLELARLKSPERILEIAQRDLKMIYPPETCYPSPKPVAAPTQQPPMQKAKQSENIVGTVQNFIRSISL